MLKKTVFDKCLIVMAFIISECMFVGSKTFLVLQLASTVKLITQI